MYRLMVQKKRSFIVSKDDVIKGGKERVYKYFNRDKNKEDTRIEIELEPGKFIYEVSDKLGAELADFDDIFIVERINDETGEKIVVETKSSQEPTLEFALAQIQNLERIVAELQKKKK